MDALDERVTDARPFAPRLLLSIAALASALVLLSLAVAHFGNALSAPLAFHGVRLGLAPEDVRARYALAGTWTSVPADELTLAWSPADPRGTVREARFEFHLGSLVAIRARVPASDEAAHGDPVSVSSAALLARSRRSDGDIDVLFVARDCPTHAKEVAKLLGTR